MAGRIRTTLSSLAQNWSMTQKVYKLLPLEVGGIFLATFVLVFVPVYLWLNWLTALILALPMALLAATFWFSRRAMRAAYTQIDGQPGAYDDLDALVTFVATAPAKTFLAEIDTRIDRRDYEDWWIFVSLIMGDDSAGKNSYHYHDPLGGPWRFAPWDFNDSFGQTWQSARKGFDSPPDGYTWANQLFTRFLAEPSIGDPLHARYGTVLAGVYAIDDILALYDAMIAEVDASARRDEGRWGQQYIDYGGWNWRNDFLTYEEEVVYMRQWMQDRWAFVDSIY